MKIVVLVGAGRSGVDLLQSLFDEHPEICQFPGYFGFQQFWQKAKKEKNLETLAKYFITDHPHFFDSRLNLIERHHMLGKDKNSFFLVDKDLFTKNFIELFNKTEINKKYLLNNLHYAYFLSLKKDISKKKIIILNLSHISNIKVLEGLDYEVIYTIRNPLGSLSSGAKHWLEYKKGKHVSPWSLYFHIERIFNGLKSLIEMRVKLHVIKLETLHQKNRDVMESLAKRINIKFDTCLSQSTYHNKLWWGDQLSGKDLNGINPNFKNNIDLNFFYKKDLLLFQKYLKNFMEKYKYEMLEQKENFYLSKYLPLKVEIKFWTRTFISMNIKEILSIVYFWIKRVCLMQERIYKNINFPTPVGE